MIIYEANSIENYSVEALLGCCGVGVGEEHGTTGELIRSDRLSEARRDRRGGFQDRVPACRTGAENLDGGVGQPLRWRQSKWEQIAGQARDPWPSNTI